MENEIQYKRKGREKEYDKEWYQKHRKEKLQKMHKIYLEHSEELREKRKYYYYKDPQKVIDQAHQWQKDNREKYNAWARNWAKTHRKKINKYVATKKKTDIQYKIKNDLRKRTSIALKRNYQTGSGIKYLGCSIPFFTKYLEKKFTNKMNWNNHTLHGWHIDHIIELNKFDLTKEEDRKKAFHYTNLQPLWAYDNLRKK